MFINGSRVGFEGSRLDWGMARVQPTIKCNTSEHPKQETSANTAE